VVAEFARRVVEVAPVEVHFKSIGQPYTEGQTRAAYRASLFK
jgi:hypothetical protein